MNRYGYQKKKKEARFMLNRELSRKVVFQDSIKIARLEKTIKSISRHLRKANSAIINERNIKIKNLERVKNG